MLWGIKPHAILPETTPAGSDFSGSRSGSILAAMGGSTHSDISTVSSATSGASYSGQVSRRLSSVNLAYSLSNNQLHVEAHTQFVVPSGAEEVQKEAEAQSRIASRTAR